MRFQAIARHAQSRFFTMDVAQRLDGDWMIVELGDGQVEYFASAAGGDVLSMRVSLNGSPIHLVQLAG